MRIGVFGGSFDPFHDGHFKLSQLAIKKLDLDQLWLVPTMQNPFKEKADDAFEKRLAVIESKVKNISKKVRVKNFGNDSRLTFATLNRVRLSNPKDSIFFIMGADNINNFDKWYRFKSIVSRFSIVIFSRENNFLQLRNYKSWKVMQKLSSKKISNKLFRIRNIDISSTLIKSIKNDSR